MTISRSRRSRFTSAPNCSVVQLRNGAVFLFGREIYNIANPELDYYKGCGRFWYKGQYHSLSQVGPLKEGEIQIPLNIAYEILAAFRELDKQLVDQVNDLFR